MAATTSRDNLGHAEGAVRDLAIQFNKLVTDFTDLRTKYVALLGKLDADAGVTDTNYTALESPAAATATQVGDDQGTAITV